MLIWTWWSNARTSTCSKVLQSLNLWLNPWERMNEQDGTWTRASGDTSTLNWRLNHSATCSWINSFSPPRLELGSSAWKALILPLDQGEVTTLVSCEDRTHGLNRVKVTRYQLRQQDKHTTASFNLRNVEMLWICWIPIVWFYTMVSCIEKGDFWKFCELTCGTFHFRFVVLSFRKGISITVLYVR